MSRYQFILESYGLQLLKPELFRRGLPLAQSHSGVVEQMPEYDTELVNMSTNADGNPVSSWMGTPVWADMNLRYSNSKTEQNLLINLDVVLVEVTNSRNIVKTALQGQDGTVKEYISDGDYGIEIMGCIFGQNPDRFPIEESQKLIEITQVKDAIEVDSEFLKLWGVTHIVIEEPVHRQEGGRQNVFPFRIRACSDIPLELQIENLSQEAKS